VKQFSTEVRKLLAKGETAVRGMIRFDFGTGTYGFIKAASPFEYGGLTYQPGGIIRVSNLTERVGGEAEQFTLTLAAAPDAGLTPEVLRTIEQEDYRDQRVTIYDAHFHPRTNALLLVEPRKRGYLDVIDHEEDPDEGYRLVATCESRALDYSRTNGRKRTTEDQARRAPGDLIYANAGQRGRGEPMNWGSLSTGAGLPTPAAAPAANPTQILRGIGLPI